MCHAERGCGARHNAIPGRLEMRGAARVIGAHHHQQGIDGCAQMGGRAQADAQVFGKLGQDLVRAEAARGTCREQDAGQGFGRKFVQGAIRWVVMRAPLPAAVTMGRNITELRKFSRFATTKATLPAELA